MSVVVHGGANSSNVQAVMCGAVELGLDVERRDVGGRFGSTDSAGFSLADIMAGHVLHRYFTLDLPRNPPAGLEAYYDALRDRPAYGAHVMIDDTELKGRLNF